MNLKWIALCGLGVVTTVLVTTGIEAQPSTSEQLLEEIRALRAEIKQLHTRLDEVEEKITPTAVEAEAEVAQNPPWADDWREVRADAEVLAEIEKQIAPDLTEQAARDLVSQIAVVTINQKHFSPDDIQTRLLVRIGRLHPAAALSAVAMPSLEHHFEYAAPRINWEQHKAQVLAHLAKAPALVTVVNRQGWSGDAGETILEGLRHQDDLPLEWFHAALTVAGPADQEALARYLAYAGAWVIQDAYTALRLTPGFDVDAVVSEAWKLSRFNRFEGRLPMAMIAVHHGEADAWPYIFDALPDPDGEDENHFGFFRSDPSPRSLIVSLTPARGSNEALKAWFIENGSTMQFDVESGKWFAAGVAAN